jgi:spore coat protein U domain-containing protein, fimbrial subunit CupE1/2/3/6
MKRRHPHFFAVALAALVSSLALSGTAQAACTISAGGAVSFGNYDWTFATPTDTVGSMTYTCTSAALVFLSTGSSGNYTTRTMLSGVDVLNYNLYVDAARTQVWGDLFNGGTISVAPAGVPARLDVYGRIPAGQNVPTGSYTDSITVTFFF